MNLQRYTYLILLYQIELIMKVVFLGLGSNLGIRESNLEQAVARIGESVGRVLDFSSLYETEPWGFQADDEFLNQVIKVKTELKPHELLERIQAIESLLGRSRGKERYESRLIDIDILFYENLIIEEEHLKIPHPLLQQRRFVLVPLCEIASEIIHPVLQKTVCELLELCKDKSKVKKYF